MAGRNYSTLVCVPLVAKTVEQMLTDMGRAKAAGADLVEIRLDHLAAFSPRQDLERLLGGRPLPALVTYRPKWEGGEYEGDDAKRLDVLRLAMEMGADYVDVELQVAPEFANSIAGKKPDNFKLIVSSHNYQSTPSVELLVDLVASIQAAGADIVKIATTAVNISDVARMFQVMVHCQVPMIGLVMKERGVISRILCPKFGGYLTFAVLDGGKESAPWQPTVTDLLNVYKIRQIGPDTRVFGIIAKPVAHSKSPLLHNAAFSSAGVNAVYVPLLVDDIADFLNVYSSPDFAGFSCGIPHKEAAVKCCDEVDPIAKSIEAVNTIIKRPDGKLIGYNTDYTAAISAIEDAMRGPHANNSNASPLSGKLFVLMGAGGAGKALAYGAKEKGATVVIANRTFDRARELAMLVGGDAVTLGELESFHPGGGMILANATSVGMHPNINDTLLSKECEKPLLSVLQRMESMFSSFFWNSDDGTHKHRWLSWRTLCKPIGQGGVGFRSLKNNLSEAFSLKRCWSLVTSNSIWSQYMKGKYYPLSTFDAATKIQGSRLWRGMIKSRNCFENFSKISIGDGSPLFFLHNWSGMGALAQYISDRDLEACAIKNITISEAMILGSPFFNTLKRLIPADIMVAYAPHLLPISANSRPTYVWMPNRLGNFTLPSAYSILQMFCHTPSSNSSSFYSLEFAWHSKIPIKLSFLMLHIFSNKLPLDSNIQTMGIHLASCCSCCSAPAVENVRHVFLDSSAASDIWSHYEQIFGISPNRRSISDYISVWLANTQGKRRIFLLQRLTAAYICWELWCLRNKARFEGIKPWVPAAISRINSNIRTICYNYIPTPDALQDRKILEYFHITPRYGKMDCIAIYWLPPPPSSSIQAQH